ncbi:hypothetical protein F0562_034509 [Nyssa sinensis]|uniref:Uncharacterized protein n=1 Tax=Nyssa sinensis TaxID=561372 RepID=A0A5J5AK70_9ASTE|nr:hypothetical protein F0562_034509 [Nyssa sinensis]
MKIAWSKGERTYPNKMKGCNIEEALKEGMEAQTKVEDETAKLEAIETEAALGNIEAPVGEGTEAAEA